MISYAQNLEDVMLQRCFASQPEGFYVDVGAMHPLLDSVTCSFYERGWSGIYIKPHPNFHALLQRFRPRDVNLEACGPRRIDFLKIDAEGWEEKIIQSNDWNRFRPTIAVVEATPPNSPQPTWQSWEPLLRRASYVFMYFDGLNRFYAAEERANLAEFFAAPPNFFDDYRRFVEKAAQDLLNGGVWSSWKLAYRKRPDALALLAGNSFDEAAFCSAWNSGKLENQAQPADLEKCYEEILGRSPDAQGKLHWLSRIVSEKMTKRALILEFLRTDEFLALRLKSSCLS
ncbi:MAG TPA: FkbM family methyltransferase [Terriglobales bacterium]|nr:FkbM family methyltransferase [Terriglobales bacterium]